MTTDTLKASIIAALRAFVNRRPGMDPRNYGDWSSYRSESRSVTRDKEDALELIRAVEWRDSISGEDLQKAFRGAFSGRLSCETTVSADGYYTAKLDYCTGQYFPTEYRRAAAAVCASALWDWMRDKAMPAPQESTAPTQPGGWPDGPLYEGVNAGTWLRAKFRAEFGARLANRYFN